MTVRSASIVLTLALLSGAVLIADQPAAAQQGQVLVLRGGTLLDGNGGAPLANAVVVIRGNRIAAVGAAGAVQIPAGAKIIDATGKWLTPGLIDAKANWNWMYGEAFLHWGVTSAMVSGARNDGGIAERDAINHGIYAGPRLYQDVLNARGGGADVNDPAYQRQYGVRDRIPMRRARGQKHHPARSRKCARWSRPTSRAARISSAPMTAHRPPRSSPRSRTKRTRRAKAW